MEESEKRRERLRAMRMEAAQAEVGGNVETSAVPGSLSNPLLKNSTNQPVREESFAAQRFDYYTDPMSAFSSNKKRDRPHNQVTHGPRNPEKSFSHAHESQSSSSYDQRIYQPRGPFSNAAAYGSPRRMASPAPSHQGTRETWNESRATTGYYISAAHGHRSPSPTMYQGPPEAWNVSAGTLSYNFPSNAAGGQFFSPGFGLVRTPDFKYGQGSPQWNGRSPSPISGHVGSPGLNSGRGRGRWHGSSSNPSLGRIGGRGQGFHSRGSGTEGRQSTEHFYHKSMDEDPWQQLQPLIWKSRSLKSAGTSNSWLPKSISVKKAK